MSARQTSEERACIAELLRALCRVRCIDSTLYIEVDEETFESFSGHTQVVADERECFRSKRVLGIPSDKGLPGGGVEVVLWTKPQRRLRVA
jgi:hypothetical protein